MNEEQPPEFKKADDPGQPTGGTTDAPKEEPKINLDRYRDLSGVSLKKLELGLWFVEHRQQLRQSLILFLIAIAAVSWSYTLYGLSYYLIRGMKEDDLLLSQLVSTETVGHDYILKQSPRDLVIFPAQVLASVENHYDFLAEVKNANAKHWAEFDYYFLINGQEEGRARQFILPAESKYLVALNQKLGGAAASAQLKLENINWHRLDQKQIPDWQQFKNERLNLIVSEVEFIPSRLSGLSERLNLSQVQFRATNNTAYNYRQAVFYTLLYNRLSLAGVNRYSLDNFRSGENYFVQLSWPGQIGRADRVEVVPEINIMDEENYFKFEGGVGGEEK